MNEVVFSHLDEIVVNREVLSDKQSADKWQVMPYSTTDIEGSLLLSGELSMPGDVTLRLGLSGWYKIFVGTVHMKSADYFALKLSSDRGFTGMRDPNCEEKIRWTPIEYFKEFLWKCADLSNESLILTKPETYFQNAVALAFIRCVPMTEEEIARETKNGHLMNIHAHIDEDPNAEDKSDTDAALLTRVDPLCGTDVTTCSLEISFDYDIPEYERELQLLRGHLGWQTGDEKFHKVREHAYKLRIDALHSRGIAAFAANRMSVAGFTPPYTNQMWVRRGFVEEHPELYVKTRDGRTINVCSYAYPETRAFVLDTLEQFAGYGFDGVTLILHRGTHIGFEQPVLDRFAELYPDVDPKRLPATDSRLNGVWCSVMTEFMTALRDRLHGLKVNVITEYTPDTSRHFGIDVAEWARRGLIDAVFQGIMETFEDLDGCIADDGLINLDLYSDKLRHEPVIKRYHNTSIERTLDGAEKYINVLRGTNVVFAATLPWPHRVAPEEYAEWKSKLYDIGVRDLLSWNTNHLMYDLPEFHAMSLSGDRLTEEYISVKQHRTLSLAGSDISTFDPNWRG